MLSYVGSRKLVLCIFAVFCLCVVFLTVIQNSSRCVMCLHWSAEHAASNEMSSSLPAHQGQGKESGRSTAAYAKGVQRKDVVNNSRASDYIAQYKTLFNKFSDSPMVPPDPNNPDTIASWWQAAAMIDWYINSPIRYRCKNKVSMGNWHICQDEPYTVKPPCLVYSFGINWDFSFDDAMAKKGCEVHSFDPSMNMSDHKRGNHSMFHDLGLGSSNSDGFIARQDMYVKGRHQWKIRTVRAIMKQLGHENRVIDVFKMDVEGYEWGILDNMIETGVFQHIRQFALEYHLFSNFPPRGDYVHIYKTVTRLREMGFREFGVHPHSKSLKLTKFNNQGDIEYINAFFEQQQDWS